MAFLRSILLCLGLVCSSRTARKATRDGAPTQQPNIIFILTDDQDLHMDSLSYMPYLKKHITEQGTTFGRHYCTVAQCCPSRVTIWTGKAAHNTNVTDVNPPYGGWPKFVSQGFNSAYLPIWLQDLGYATYYIGKLFNAHSVENYGSPRAAGWTGSEFLLNPYTYEYLNATFVRNHDGRPVSYEGQYSTDVISDMALGFLDDALNEYEQENKPFFMTIAPNAPHSNVHMNTLIDGNFSEGSNTQSPPVPAARHAHLFEDVVVPRTSHFNPENPHGVSWIEKLPRQNQTNVDFNDHFYRSRLRALQAVDEMIDAVFAKLDEAGVTEEAYVFFTTDNGYHIGQHRLQPGKQCPFEEDVHIPMIVRGPGIPRNWSTEIVTTHTDLAPTFVKLAGGVLEHGFDGQVLPLHGLDRTETLEAKGSKLLENEAGKSLSADVEDWTTEHINIEAWGVVMSEGNHGSILYPNHTYKALRVIGQGYSLLYTIWCSGEHELYNLLQDPHEMENLYTQNHFSTLVAFDKPSSEQDYHSDISISHLTLAQSLLTDTTSHHSNVRRTYSIARILDRLDTLIMVLKSCTGRSCTHPWEILHPRRDVRSLKDAMRDTFDVFYAKQQKVKFDRCEKGYILDSEGPMYGGEAWT
ncbi:Arylsulfatase [Cercospora zeina]